MKKYYLVIAIILAILAAGMCVVIIKHEDKPANTNTNKPVSDNPVGTNYDFDYDIIKKVHETYKTDNYMISPLSIGYALSILEVGASDKTKSEIESVLKGYKLPKVNNVKDRIGIANALFIKEDFKNAINNSFVSSIKDNYDADLIYDKFKTPDKLNNWVKNKTFEMIPKVIDDMDPNFILGIANAIAIDVEWKNKFACESTTKEEFNLLDNTKLEVAMMHQSEGISYFETKNAKGIIKDYAKYNPETGKIDNEKGIELEYIAILPDDIDSYIKSFNLDELHSYEKNVLSNVKANLSLPKYTYDFSYDTIKDDLKSMGIIEAFDEVKANFDNISSTVGMYVDKVLHKSHIELSENGTKAAAVTVIMLNYKSAIDERKIVNIKFDKPFIYIIKEKNTDNIWFFGTVYKPMKYEDHKCETVNKLR